MGARLIGIATRSMISRAGGASGPVSEDLQRVHRPAAGWLFVGLCQKTTLRQRLRADVNGTQDPRRGAARRRQSRKQRVRKWIHRDMGKSSLHSSALQVDNISKQNEVMSAAKRLVRRVRTD